MPSEVGEVGTVDDGCAGTDDFVSPSLIISVNQSFSVRKFSQRKSLTADKLSADKMIKMLQVINYSANKLFLVNLKCFEPSRVGKNNKNEIIYSIYLFNCTS